MKSTSKSNEIALAIQKLINSIFLFLSDGIFPPSEQYSDEIVLNLRTSISSKIHEFQSPALSIESQVKHPTLNYIGYFDALAFHLRSKKVVLIDWKTTEKPKLSLKATYDAPLQVAAYVGALNHDLRYPYQIENALIVVVNKTGKEATILKMDKKNLIKYWLEWIKRCKAYEELKD